MKNVLYFLLAFAVLLSSCRKDEDDLVPNTGTETNTNTNTDNSDNTDTNGEVSLNEFIDLNNQTIDFSFEVLSEKEVNGYIQGSYKLSEADDSFEDLIRKGSLVYLPDSLGKLILVTNVSVEKNLDLEFEGINAGLNFIYANGRFEYAGYPNRSKLAVQEDGSVPQGLYVSQEPPILESFDYKSENENVSIQIDGQNNFVLNIDELKLVNETNAKVGIKDAQIKINPTFDIFARYEEMSESERDEYLQDLEDSHLIENVSDFAQYTIGNCEEVGVISYTDFDGEWITDIEVSGISNLPPLSDTIKIFSGNKLFKVGGLPISVKTTGYLRATSKAAVSITEELTTSFENDIVVGAVYNLQSEEVDGIKEINSQSETSVDIDVTAEGFFKIEYVQEVEVFVLGVIGPNLEITPHVAAEVYYEYNSTSGSEYKNLGLYCSSNFDYSCDLSVFHIDKLRYPIPTSVLSYESGVHIDRKYFYKLPSNLEIISGDNQIGVTGQELAEPIRVKVTDNLGNPLYNVIVAFSPESGSVSSISAKTDINGIAEVNWTPGAPTINDEHSELKVRLLYHEYNESADAFYPNFTDEKTVRASVNGGNVYEGDIILDSQNKVNAFGLNNYSSVNGGVVISGNDITDLSPLLDLTEITGNLDIVISNTLVNLNGLDNLNTIGATLLIDHCENLQNLDALESLEIVYGNLKINFCSSLLDFCGIQNLVQGGGIFNNYQVEDNAYNPSLQDLINGDCFPTSSGTYEGDITLSTQAEVNDFGSNGYTSVSGSIIINGNNVTDLSPLNTLIEVTSNLTISQCTNLINVDGLNSIQRIGADLFIQENPSLGDITGLSSLNSVSTIYFYNNDAIVNLEGFENLTNVIQIYFTVNAGLSSFHGLHNLHTCEYFVLGNNAALTTLNGLETLVNVENLTISLNENLSDFCGIQNLIQGNGLIGNFDVSNNAYNPTLQDMINGDCTAPAGGGTYTGEIVLSTQEEVNTFGANVYSVIDGSLVITGDDISDLTPLNSITEITETFRAFRADGITDFTGMESLNTIGKIFLIEECDELTSLIGLERLISVDEDLKVEFCPNLNTLEGLDNLITIGIILTIEGNTSLIHINNLVSLQTIGTTLDIEKNSSLMSLGGLENLTYVKNISIHDNLSLNDITDLINVSSPISILSIHDNPNLNNLEGLNNITSAGNITISDNNLLSSISALEGIQVIGGSLSILNNVNLQNLGGLNGITSVPQGVQIMGNSSLINLDDLSSISNIEGNLTIRFNNMLNDFCGLNNLIQTNGLMGTYLVNNNVFNPTQEDILNGNCSQ